MSPETERDLARSLLNQGCAKVAVEPSCKYQQGKREREREKKKSDWIVRKAFDCMDFFTLKKRIKCDFELSFDYSSGLPPTLEREGGRGDRKRRGERGERDKRERKRERERDRP